jgi:hypothetical protein
LLKNVWPGKLKNIIVARKSQKDSLHGCSSIVTMVHEWKLCETHRLFWEKKQHLPELCTASNIFLESDKERAIINVLLALQGFSV